MTTPQVPPPGEDGTGLVPSPDQRPYQPGPAAPPPGPSRRRHRGRNILLSAAAALFAIIVISSVVSHGGKSQGRTGTPGAGTSTAARAATTQALSASAQQFASDLQSSSLFSIGSSTSTQIAAYGQQVCSMRQDGQKQTAVISYTKTAWSNMSSMLANAMTRLAEHDMCASDLPGQTVAYIVRGTAGAQVTYGPDGSDFNGSTPMKVTHRLGNPEYYAISAQLQGGGSVRCSIEVDGIPVSTASASGGYNIADCEIGQDPITNLWENDNSG